ncbi:hypothetical protein C441_17444 [Haloferax sulfurifontis ATCC BAA-897]|uniref:Uncharacterized protein n=1 Tax=Haloferax sulfurifontis ATCC BAA-897 TaxID=662480 RepID=M0HZW3_9EURY|nr:hypothetical protein C441_17444 [Haloferax sulfurifontis ATCC BAA-897]
MSRALAHKRVRPLGEHDDRGVNLPVRAVGRHADDRAAVAEEARDRRLGDERRAGLDRLLREPLVEPPSEDGVGVVVGLVAPRSGPHRNRGLVAVRREYREALLGDVAFERRAVDVD